MTRPKTPKYSDDEIRKKLESLPGWTYEEGWLRRRFQTDGWPTTLLLVNQIAFVSEAAWHHPDLSVSWAKVTVKLMTHSENGITDKDFELARRIDELALWRPAEGSALEGTPNKFVKNQ
jgi:4a-hydroxytetrahydrobiopterin dehydratase